MDELASDSPAKGTRPQKAATATKTAAGEEDGGEDVRVLSTEEVAAVAATAARAPDVPKAALLALIHHFIDTDYRVKEGSKDAAEKKRAWTAELAVFNTAAADAGVTYQWSVPQVKTLFLAARHSAAKKHECRQSVALQSNPPPYWAY